MSYKEGRWTISKVDSNCAGCFKALAKNETIFFIPPNKKVICSVCMKKPNDRAKQHLTQV